MWKQGHPSGRRLCLASLEKQKGAVAVRLQTGGQIQGGPDRIGYCVWGGGGTKERNESRMILRLLASASGQRVRSFS